MNTINDNTIFNEETRSEVQTRANGFDGTIAPLQWLPMSSNVALEQGIMNRPYLDEYNMIAFDFEDEPTREVHVHFKSEIVTLVCANVAHMFEQIAQYRGNENFLLFEIVHGYRKRIVWEWKNFDDFVTPHLIRVSVHDFDYARQGVPSLLSCARREFFRSKIQSGESAFTFLPNLFGNKEIQSHIEDAALFITAICGATSISSKVAILIMEMKKHKLSMMYEDYEFIFEFVKECFTNFTSTQGAFDGVSDGWKKIARSDIAKSLGKLVVFILSLYKFGIKGNLSHFVNGLSRCGVEKIFEGGDMILGLLSAFEIVLTRVRQYFATGEWSDLVHSEDAYGKLEDEYKQVKIDYVRLRRREKGLDRHGLLTRVRDLIERATRMMEAARRLKTKHVGLIDLYKVILDLEDMNNEMSSKIDAQKPRMTPIGVLVVGKSSVGKSSFMRMLHVHLCHVRKKERISLEDIYVRNPEDPFYTGHTSTMITIIIDDAAIIRPARVQGVDKTMGEIVFLVNTVQSMPLYASLEEKGMNPIMAEQVIISSNVQDLNIPTYFSCPLAIARRLPFRIEISPKKQYCKEGTDQLDGKKVPKTSFPDIWDIRVQKCIVAPGDEDKMCQNFMYVNVCPDSPIMGLHRFLAWYKETIIDHFDKQEIMLDSNDMLVDSDYCDECIMPHRYCFCAEKINPEICELCGSEAFYCVCQTIHEQAGEVVDNTPLYTTISMIALSCGFRLIGGWCEQAVS
jgi:hypothetical protein